MNPASFTTSAGVATLPAVPLGVTATVASATQINLAWTAVTGATGYNVYRASAAGVAINAANKITVTPVATASFSNTALTAATAYFYKVTAVNGAGESVGSAEVTATTSAAGGVGTPVLLAGGGGLVGSFDNTGAAARFGIPHGIVTDSLGNAYVADGINKSIRKITPAGVVSTFVGPDYVACGGDIFLGTNCPIGDTDGTGTAA